MDQPVAASATPLAIMAPASLTTLSANAAGNGCVVPGMIEQIAIGGRIVEGDLRHDGYPSALNVVCSGRSPMTVTCTPSSRSRSRNTKTRALESH